MMRIALLLMISAATLAAQTWQQEGVLKKLNDGPVFTSPLLGCTSGDGTPVLDLGWGIAEVDLTTAQVAKLTKKGPYTWHFLPRCPRVYASVQPDTTDGMGVTLTFSDAYRSVIVATVTEEIDVSSLQLDVTDSWVANDGIEGCVVFAPTDATPDEKKEYVVLVFRNQSVTFLQRIKPKVDVDIYVQPNTEDGLVYYLRGNGISFPPSTEEVFTNGSYLRYDASGRRTRLDLPTRGPGSGKGRSIIWSSVKWDRLLMTDEFASGALLVKASNGIVVDSITSSQLAPGENVRILSASGNINDRWMATHVRVGGKNAITLWAMPETKEVTSVEFSAGDAATKQMPLSPWTVVIPFVSTSSGQHTLYSWNPQDVVSVDEEPASISGRAYPLPATDRVTIATTLPDGAASYAIMSTTGERVATGTAAISNGLLEINTSSLSGGSYSIELSSRLANQPSSRLQLQHTSILITR